MLQSKTIIVSVEFRVPYFSSVLIRLLELSCERMLKLLPSQRNQGLIMLPSPRKVMEVMDLVMLTENLNYLNVWSLLSLILLHSSKLCEFAL